MVFRTQIFVLLLLLGVYTQTFAVGTHLTEIQQLLHQGESETAYARLLAMQITHEGELEYDLLLVQAALITDHANVALFVLERILIVHPRHYQARLLMASAYVRLGRPALARSELRIILAAKSAQPQLKQQAESMLAQLSAEKRKSRLDAYVAMGFGYDGNANASTDSQTFLGFDLSPESIATPSMSEMLNIGSSWQHQLASRSIVYATLDWRSSLFPQAVYANNELLRYQLGWQKPRYYAFVYQGSSVNTNATFNNSGNHLFGMWHTGKRRESNVFLRIGEQHYLTSQNIKDVTQYMLGSQISLAEWIKDTRLVTILSQDVAVLPTSPYGRNMIGLNMQTKLKSMNPFTVNIGGGVLYSEYEGLFFGQGRQEQQFSLNVGLHTKRWTNWELALDLSYTDTRSTIVLYDYDRFTLGLNFKRNYVR